MSSDICDLPIKLEELKTEQKPLKPINKNRKLVHSFDSKMSAARILTLLIFTVTMVSLILLVITWHSTLETRQKLFDERKKTEIQIPCYTLSCMEAAVEIINSLNTSVDPCEDFYEFACGKWQSDVLSKGITFQSILNDLMSKFVTIQEKLLEGSEFKSISPVYSKVTQLYESCMNLHTINGLDSKPLHNYLNKLFGKYGGWEMLFDDMNSSLSNWDLKKVIEDPLIETPVFKLEVYRDLKNTSRNIFFVNLASLLLERNLLKNSEKPENIKVLDAYREYMYEIGKLLNLKKNKFNKFDEILKLEIQVSKKHPTNEEVMLLENNYNTMKVTELQNKYCPEFNWKEIFKRRMEFVKLKMQDDMDVLVYKPVHLREICRLFKYDENTVRTIHNYVIWKSVRARMDYLSVNFLQADYKFQKVATGFARNADRFWHCINVVHYYMSPVLENMYVNTNFNRDFKTQVTEIFNLLKDKFHENLLRNTWMDEEMRSHAIKKINYMSSFIGYSDSIINITNLEEDFKSIEISNKTYFENMEKLINRSRYKTFQKLGKKPKKTTETFMRPNGYYAPNKNELIFPAGILQNPFFEPGFPRSLKFGGIGIMMGNELTYGFDEKGSRYDYMGNLRLWWTNKTQKRFETKSDCFVKQYSKYSMHGHYINGKGALSKHIADNGGLRLAYQVYKDLEYKYGKEKGLPLLNYTNEQLFFISFARTRCLVQTKQSAISQILSSVNTPDRYRVIGALSNLKEFAETFNCPLGSPMNPREKCILW